MKHLITLPVLALLAACEKPAVICNDDPGTAKLDAVSDCRDRAPWFTSPTLPKPPQRSESSETPVSAPRSVGRDTNLDPISEDDALYTPSPGPAPARVDPRDNPTNKRTPAQWEQVRKDNAMRVMKHTQTCRANRARQGQSDAGCGSD